ncbi:AZIN2 inhibitor, partial [Corythaeola cristata]|nr:AZIN2 inhibitor [Corythaeola cristata]
FLKALPRVKPYFPVKCNGSEGVIRLLAELGAGFACTNKAEIARVQSIGVPADKVFYSSPCKQIAHIKYAASRGVRLMAFDNEVELSKVARSHPHARMLLGIAADSSPSAHPSMTFGTTLKSCRHLLETAKEQAVEVVGIRYSTWFFFHRGAEPPGEHLLPIQIAAVMNSALDLYFPDGCGVEIVATPGRYYVTSAFTFAASITAMEEVPVEQPGSDGTWDGGMGLPVCPSPHEPSPCSSPEEEARSISPLQRPCPDRPLHSSSLRGPPGHAEDRIADGLELPELQVGDWLVFQDMGAYTITTSSLLEGWPQPQVTYAMSRVAWKAIQLFQGKPPQTEDDRESICTPLSCGWETAETLCVTPAFAPASII